MPSPTSPRARHLAAIAGAALVAASCAPAGPPFRTFSGEAMATRWEIVLPERADAAAAAARGFARLEELDLLLSEWKPSSPLSAINRAAGVEPVAVPEELYRLLERALELGRRTDGAFDVSWAALWGLWDFRAAAPELPDPGTLAARARLVDYRAVRLDAARRTVFLPRAGMKLGLGGIGKGYALDAVAALLEADGFGDFLLVGGGQVVARGTRAGRPGRVGLRDPRGGRGEYFARVPLGDASLSTTADNESFFEIDGVRFHHVLDPRTGWPSRGLRSASVLHPDATLADALSTAVMVLGRERGFALARELGAEVATVDVAGALEASAGLAARWQLLRLPRRGPGPP